MTEAHLDEIEAFGRHGQQMLAFDRQCFANRLLAPLDSALQFFFARRQQHGIELVQVTRGGHWDKVIAAEEPSFTFNAAFFVPLTGRAELGCKSPVRAERDKARRTFQARQWERSRGFNRGKQLTEFAFRAVPVRISFRS